MTRKELKRAFRAAQSRPGQAFRLATAAFRPLPSVFVIGAMKAGTTSLFRELINSPSVRPSVRKEVHFFDMKYERGELFYRSWFRMRGGEAVLDCTPSYMFYSPIASKICEMVPDAKIVAILRDPAERAWSHYRHNIRRRRMQRGEEDFSIRIERDIQAWEAERLPNEWTKVNQSESYVRRGIYVDQLEPYFELFGDRVAVLQAEKLYRNPQPEIDRLSTFLDIEAPRATLQPHNVGKALSWKPDLSRLKDFFAPHNERLYRLLDVEPWWPY